MKSKRIVVSLLSLCLAAALFACGGPANPPAAATTAPPAQPAATAPAQPPAVQVKTEVPKPNVRLEYLQAAGGALEPAVLQKLNDNLRAFYLPGDYKYDDTLSYDGFVYARLCGGGDAGWTVRGEVLSVTRGFLVQKQLADGSSEKVRGTLQAQNFSLKTGEPVNIANPDDEAYCEAMNRAIEAGLFAGQGPGAPGPKTHDFAALAHENYDPQEPPFPFYTSYLLFLTETGVAIRMRAPGSALRCGLDDPLEDWTVFALPYDQAAGLLDAALL